MATYWWGVALAFALTAAGVKWLGVWLPWLVIALGCAIGGAISLYRHQREKQQKGQWRARDGQRKQEELRGDHQTIREDIQAVRTDLDTVLGLVQQLLPRAKEAVEARSGPIGKQLVAVINEKIVALQGTIVGSAGRLSAQMTVMGPTETSMQAERQRQMVAAVAEAKPLLEDIIQDPPQTPEEVSRAVASLNHLLRAESGKLTITGADARLIHRNKDGNVIDER